MTFKAYIRNVDIKRVIKGSAAHTKLIKAGYKRADQYSHCGVKWVEMRKELPAYLDDMPGDVQ